MAILVSDAELSDFKKRFGRLEDCVKNLAEAFLKQKNESVRDEYVKRLEKFDLLLEQLSRHVNPTRDDVLLLKRTNRELARELKKVHGLLDKQKYD